MSQRQHILGISAFYHDSAACLLRDGEIVAAAQEERFTRKKGDASFPKHAIDYCLRTGNVTATDLAFVGFYDKPLLKFERILETYLGVAPRGFRSFLLAGPLWIKEKLHMEKQIREGLGYAGEVLYAEHHESHAASAFFPSPFEEAAILTVDGVGEWDNGFSWYWPWKRRGVAQGTPLARFAGASVLRLHILAIAGLVEPPMRWWKAVSRGLANLWTPRNV